MFRKLLAALFVAGSLSAAFAAPTLAAPTAPPQSCADVHAANPTAPDGPYTIYPNHEQFTVYCNNMAGAPAEYLSLVNTGGTFNVSFNAGDLLKADGTSTTHFSKVRLDPATLLVDVSDYTFATFTTTGTDPKFAGGTLAAYAYATAAGCWGGPGSNAGMANVDLTGTPFAIASTFNSAGNSGFGQATLSANHQVANLTGGGFCGGEGPVFGTGNGTAGMVPGVDGFTPFDLQLAYTGATDTTPPTITASATTADGQAYSGAWTKQNVVVSFSCADSGFGVASCPAPVTVSSEGANQSVSGTAVDNAGNTASASFSNINIDKTPPAITYSGNAGSYTVDQTVSITCTATDNLSGVASSTCANANDPAYTYALGSNTLSATATDKAGNTGSGSTSFTVSVNAASLDSLISRFVADAGVAQSLKDQVSSIASAPNSNSKAGKLGGFDHLLSAQSGKSISQQDASTLQRLAQAL